MPNPTPNGAPTSSGKRTGAGETHAPLEEQTREELFALAQRLQIPGHTEMSRTELIEAIRKR